MKLGQIPFRAAHSIRRRVGHALGVWKFKAVGVSFGSGLRLHGAPIVSMAPGSEIRLGTNVEICSDSEYTHLGVAHPAILRTIAGGAVIWIGDDVGMSGATICAQTRVNIGDRVLLGANVTIVDTDFHPLQPQGRRYTAEPGKSAPVVIERDVFIGTNSMILKGVTVGHNTVIGAGSVVTKDVPADCVAAGNPCRVIRSFQSGEAPFDTLPVAK